MKIVFFGTPPFVVPILQTLEDHFDVVGVVTTPDAPVGRKQVMTPSPIKVAYESYIKNPKHNAVILTPEQFDTQITEQLRNLNPDLFVTAAYGKIIPYEVLTLPSSGSINIHPSLLPLYRGASPIQASIANGDSETGVSIIQMDDKMDHGPIIYQEKVAISDKDTFETLSNKLFQKSAVQLPHIIREYVHKKIVPQPQDDSQATFTWKTSESKQQAYFDSNNPPSLEKLDRMIRAYYPWPVTWTKWNNKVVKFYPNRIIQLEGKKPVSMETFIQGYPESKEWIKKLFPES